MNYNNDLNLTNKQMNFGGNELQINDYKHH